MPRTCTRKLEFDAAHRVMQHESKCRHLHGHRYTVEVTVAASDLDDLGRVIDFGVVKAELGAWIDAHLDHGAILNEKDTRLIELCRDEGWRVFTMPGNPTAENLAELLFEQAETLFGDRVTVAHVRVLETPNCWADFSREDRE